MGGYQPAVYREQGGNTIVIASSGKISMENGSTMTVASGAAVGFDSGATLSVASGVTFYEAAQTLTTTGTATAVTANGFTLLTATTTGPTYTLAAPTYAGQAKDIAITASSSGATHRAVLYAGTTDKTFGQVAGDMGNTLTFASTTCHGVRLRASSTTAWRILGFYPVAPTLSNKST